MHTHVIASSLRLRLLFSAVFLLLLLCACGQTTTGGSTTSSAPTPQPTALDAYGKPIVFPKTAPQRIVSLTPGNSETLAALNLESRIVGVDYYTNYPASLTKLPKVSDVNGTFNVEKIASLKPDLVLSYGEETKQYDTQLQQLGLDVVDLPTVNFSQTLQQIALVGRLTLTQNTANALVTQLQQQVNQIKTTVAGTSTPSVLLEVDDSTPGKPYVFGGGSFGDEMLQDANATNIFHTNMTNGGFPQVSDESIISANPQYVILTEDPAYGGSASAVYKRPNWGNIAAVKHHDVFHVNSDIVQRPSPRLVEGLRCLAQTLHPDKFTGALPDYCSATV
jgi:iron complex transport system substrate-binding protein